MQAKNYTSVALIYEYLMRSVNYKSWAKYIFLLSKLLKKKNVRVLELACGNGKIAEQLSKRFSCYDGCDLSLQMLMQSEQANIKKINCDITLLPFKTKYDFVFSTFDSVNYLATKKKIIKMLKEVSGVLTEDGVFTFDVSLEKNSLNNLRSLNREGEYQGIKFKQISTFNKLTRIHQNKFVIKGNDGKSYTEIHKQKVYQFNDYFEMISKTDFYVYNCYETFTFNDASSKSERAQFVLKKRKSNADF